MRGRFAPTPSGPLHLGSLVAAVGSCLSARSRGGEWLVRIEDLDRAREQPGASDGILRTLEAFGFEWDGSVEFQSRRSEHYALALRQLDGLGRSYACRCSRRQLRALASGFDGEPVYPGTCREDSAAREGAHALRFRIPAAATPVSFEDRHQGWVSQDCAREAGDFVVRRRDGYYAYHLAVVVDDALQGITEVVRGADLLDSTPRQILLQQALGLPRPVYGHLPLVTEADGAKLAKSRRALALDAAAAPAQLIEALALLRQDPPEALRRASPREIWGWARERWQEERLRGVRELRLPLTGPASTA